MKKWTPSKIASSSIYFAKKMLNRENPWCNAMAAHSGYSMKQVRECARDICIILNKTTKKKQINAHKSITRKFSTRKFLGVANIPARMRQEALKNQQIGSEGTTSQNSSQNNGGRQPSDIRMHS
jgi:hypothetical protein